ncbi:MAG: hypothetical protein J7L95_06470, partial [Prolixibacteraceae bacterium]|nr:hypothetical protein [Prolixibacteraceae bacterium]
EVKIENLNFSSDAPIIIKAYNDEKVTFDGTVALKNLKWEKDPTYPNVWQAHIPVDVWQLFVDGRMMINARWPNAQHPFENEEYSSWWDRGKSWRHVQYKIGGKVVSGFDFKRAKGFLVDDGAGQSLAGLNFSAKGLMGVLNVNSMDTYVGRISKHEAGSSYFEYDVNERLQNKVRDPKENNLRRILTKNTSHAYYYFEGWNQLLDTPDEWAYDKISKTLYLYSENGEDLKRKNIKGKVQTTAFYLKNCNGVTIQGLNFFATCVQAFDCKQFQLKDNTFDYPSYSKRMLGSLDDIEVLTIENSIGKKERAKILHKENGTQNVFQNNIVRYCDGRGLHLAGGAFDVVDNNFFKYIDISGCPGGSVGLWVTGWRNLFRRNTLEVCGSSKATKAGDAGLATLNRISKFGYLQDDGTAIQASGVGQHGTIYLQNWVHDSPKSGLRFDGNENSDAFERQIYNGSMVRNVIFNNNGGLMVKGDDHRIYCNTCYNTINDAYKILTSSESKHSNHETVTRNNIGDFMNASRRDDPILNPPVGPTDHNWVNNFPKHDLREILRDPDNLDFRPRPDAVEIIDKGVAIPSELLRCGVTIPDFTSDFTVGEAPDIGAYEYGAKNYWIAGFQDKKASTPIPPDKTTTAKPDADLMWLPALNSVMFRIYIGNSPKNMKLLTEQDNNIADPGELDPSKTYFWRVDCKTDKGWVKGDTWIFQAKGLKFKRGTSLPVSYKASFAEAYDFDPNNLEQNSKGLIMPWIRQYYNGCLLDIKDNTMWIEPSVDRKNEFEPIEIPNINIDLERFPFLSFSYKTTSRKYSFGFSPGFVAPGGKGNTRRIFPETCITRLSPSPDNFTRVFLRLDTLVENGKRQFNNAVVRNFLVQFYGPDDIPWSSDDGAIIIGDFEIGFAALLDKINHISIVSQRHPVVAKDQAFHISLRNFQIEVKVKGSEEKIEFPESEPLPDGWRLEIEPGKNYTIVDHDIIKFSKGFTGILHVKVKIETKNVESNIYLFDVEVN